MEKATLIGGREGVYMMVEKYILLALVFLLISEFRQSSLTEKLKATNDKVQDLELKIVAFEMTIRNIISARDNSEIRRLIHTLENMTITNKEKKK